MKQLLISLLGAFLLVTAWEMFGEHFVLGFIGAFIADTVTKRVWQEH